jgi:hypothetical protein
MSSSSQNKEGSNQRTFYFRPLEATYDLVKAAKFEAAAQIQKVSRAWLAKRFYIIIYCCALMLETYWRRILAQKYVSYMINSKKSHEKSYEQKAGEKDTICKKNDIQETHLKASENYEMMRTIKWMSLNVKELRECIKKKTRCYSTGSTSSESSFAEQPEDLPLKKLFFSGCDNEFLSSQLRMITEQIVYVQETAEAVKSSKVKSIRQRSQLTSIHDQEVAPSRTAMKEMHMLRKHVERLRKDILKTQSQIDILVPTREYNLRMRKAAATEICNLEKQKASLLCRYGKLLDKQRESRNYKPDKNHASSEQ